MVSKTKSNVDKVQDVEDTGKICCLCADDIRVWAIGNCKHPVCYVCSARMRVLNNQRDCAICKQEMEMVVFHDSLFDYKSINITSLRKEADYGIAFFTQDSSIKFNELQLEKCKICKGEKEFVAKDAKELKQHMSRKHTLFSCQLCTDNYLLFPAERRWYNRQDLARHRREGDPDNKSHKGHPACKFCDERYLDDHELYKHLRKEHFTCHICEAEDGTRDFLQNLRELIKHFRKKHFLCEHRDCVDNPLVSAFRVELDLKIHIADRHGTIDKKDLRIEVGLSKNHDPQRRQEEIEEEIEEISNQPLPDMQSEELFPTLGGFKQFTGSQTGNKNNSSLASKMGQSAGRNVAHKNYRSLTSQNINSTEDFPSLGGPAAPAPTSNKMWSKKAVQNNKPVTKPIYRSAPSRAAPPAEPPADFPSLGGGSNRIPDHSEMNWSQAPDVFVEKSQLQLRAEKEENERNSQKKKKNAPQRDHQQFPTLGGGGKGAGPAAFWGVPGSSIPKSASKKQKKKAKVLPVPAALPRASDPCAFPAYETPKNEISENTQKVKTSVESNVNRGEVNSASDIAARLTGGYSGWSAPPETFEIKSLIEIDDEKRRTQKKFKNQKVPKENDFPTLGGGAKKTGSAPGFWGVPGNSIPKSNKTNNKKKSKGAQVKSPPKADPAPPPMPTQQLAKKKVSVEFTPAPPKPNEDQSASILASRMSGGYSGWSAPPTVFKEKTLLEIEEEMKREKIENQEKQQISWSPKDDEGSFPTLGGSMSDTTRATMAYEFSAKKNYSKKFTPEVSAAPAPSGSAAQLVRAAKKKEQISKIKKINRNSSNNQLSTENKENVRIEPESENREDGKLENEFPAIEKIEISENTEDWEEEEEEIEDEEDSMDEVNRRLTQAILALPENERNLFKLTSGKFRTGGITAEEYCSSGCSIMSKSSFMSLLPDLLRTLPDGKHKRALYEEQLRLINQN